MWDNSNRPEQLFVVAHLRQKYPNWNIQTEYPVNNLFLDDKPFGRCILDIAIPYKKIGIRMNGGYHHVSKRQSDKDEYQKTALQQSGWKIFDFDDFMMPNVFKKKKNEATIKLAINEIENQLSEL